MSKRGIIIISIISILISSIVIGYTIYMVLNNSNDRTHISDDKITDECTIEGELYELGLLDDNVYASSTDQKISPNASLLIKKYYKECKHTTKDFVELPNEIVNMTEAEVKETYKDFKLERFSSNEIILYKEEEGMCNEHYVLREKEGIIAIYKIEDNGRETLVEETGISTEYLPETDLINVQNGIKIYGKEKLNAAIEDFE